MKTYYLSLLAALASGQAVQSDGQSGKGVALSDEKYPSVQVCLQMESFIVPDTEKWYTSQSNSIWELYSTSGVSRKLVYNNQNLEDSDYKVCTDVPAGDQIEKIDFYADGDDGMAVQDVHVSFPDGTRQYFFGKTEYGNKLVSRIGVDGNGDMPIQIKDYAVFCPNSMKCSLLTSFEVDEICLQIATDTEYNREQSSSNSDWMLETDIQSKNGTNSVVVIAPIVVYGNRKLKDVDYEAVGGCFKFPTSLRIDSIRFIGRSYNYNFAIKDINLVYPDGSRRFFLGQVPSETKKWGYDYVPLIVFEQGNDMPVSMKHDAISCKLNHLCSVRNAYDYEGDFIGGLKVGLGNMTIAKKGNLYLGSFPKGVQPAGARYEGPFVKNKMSGNCKFYFKNGDLYEGEIVDGKLTGKGSRSYRSERFSLGSSLGNGDYIGDFIEGERTGNGTWSFWWFDKTNGVWKETTSRYEGQFLNGLFHGQGKYYYLGELFYEAEYVNGKKEGQGKQYSNGKLLYEGEYFNDKRHGSGKYHWTCSYYEGQFVNGKSTYGAIDYSGCPWSELRYEGEFGEYFKRTGAGTLYLRNGDRFEGNFDNRKKSGFGKFFYANGDIYEGQYVDGKRSGPGKFLSANKDRYEGEFANDKRSGTGILYYSNGDRYEGSFAEDKKSGTGIFYYSNGDRYEGNFADDMFNGPGKFYWSNGNRYEGGFFDNKITDSGKTDELGQFYFAKGETSGTGVFKFPGGDSYEGDIVDGKLNGSGKFNFTSGDRYVGDFVDGLKTGPAIFYFSDGGRYEGNFVDDQRHGLGKLYWSNGDRYEGDFVNGKRTGSGKIYWKVKNWSKGEYLPVTMYEGDFVDDNITGSGTLFFKDYNGTYLGEFVNNKREGQGTYCKQYADTGKCVDEYKGGWFNDKLQGKVSGFRQWGLSKASLASKKKLEEGCLKYKVDLENLPPPKDAEEARRRSLMQVLYGFCMILAQPRIRIETFEGTFNEGWKKSGEIKFMFGGGRYEGAFWNKKMHGKGIYYFANGDSYEGDFARDTMSGQGVYNWSNGDRYEGTMTGDYGNRYNLTIAAHQGEGIKFNAGGTAERGTFFENQLSAGEICSTHALEKCWPFIPKKP